MKQETEQGVSSIIVLGIIVFIMLGAALLITTHEPGNPPFSFNEEKINKESDTGKGSSAFSSPAPETKENIKPDTGKSTKASPLPVAPRPAVNPSPVSYSLPTPSQKMPPPAPYARPQESCKSNINPQFTQPFTDLSMIDALNPIGGIGGGSPGRSYIGVKQNMEAPVYAPADAILQRIIYADRGGGYGEYGIFLRISCEVEILFDHIDRLSDNILPYAPKTAVSTTRANEGAEMNVPIKAGGLLGYTNGTDLARTFDFLVQNYAKKNSFINPNRWEWDQALYGSCPYDYFVADLKSRYYEKLGKPSMNGFIKADECGNPSHDVAGTASGGWFKGNSTDKRGEYLAIAKDYNGVQIATRLDGNAFASTQDVQQGNPYFNMIDFSPKKYPTEVKPGESTCYSDNNKWAFIKLTSAADLLLATGNGPCPSDFPESQASAWIR